jgi:hypothetical protein
MSDQPPTYPPAPPPSSEPPAAEPQGPPAPPPAWAPASPPPPPAPAPAYQPAPYQPPPPAYPPDGMPGQPSPVLPMAVGGGVSLLSQFTGSAMWSCLLGLVSIIVPFVFGRIFFFLPLIGLFYGVRAIQRGQMIGGIVGIVLCALGGIITLIGLFGG